MLKISKSTKSLISLGIIVATLGFAVYFLSTHKNLISELSKIPLSLIFIIFLLYFVMLLVLIGVFKYTALIAGAKVKPKDNLELNMISLFMNFFIPGQSGPIYRGYYLLKNYKVKIKTYITSTIIYFSIYALVACLLILLGVSNLYLDFLFVLILIIALILSKKYLFKKINFKSLKLSFINLISLCLVTLLQFMIQGLIYYLEIRSVDPHIAVRDVLVYTGTAGLALFVALTPGAIGIREAFLIFSEKLNHLSSLTIIASSLIDRSVYILFLLTIGLLIAIFHINKKYSVKKESVSLSAE